MMDVLPPQMDPMDSFLVMLVAISVASGMPHPDSIEFSCKGIFKFIYGWMYGAAQSLCQNASKFNPSLGNLTVQRPPEHKIPDQVG